MTDIPQEEPEFYTIHVSEIMRMLREAHDGGDPDLIFTEAFANSVGGYDLVPREDHTGYDEPHPTKETPTMSRKSYSEYTTAEKKDIVLKGALVIGGLVACYGIGAAIGSIRAHERAILTLAESVELIADTVGIDPTTLPKY